MTTPTQQTNARRWVLPFLAALIAALAAILLGTSASTSAAGVAETRVGAFNVVGEVPVGPPEHIAAGQRLGNDVAGPDFVVATGVALTPGRLQHGTRHLTEKGILPAWSGTKSPAIIERALTPILEHPAATFDHVLGDTPVRGFLGEIDGQQVVIFVYKAGPYQGQLASSVVPSTNQLTKWGLN